MKFFAAIALIAAVASATIIQPIAVSDELAEIQDILAAINSPSTDPATAALLEQMLFDVLGVAPESVGVGPAIIPEPISVGPALIEPEYEPISIEPALVDFPVEDAYEPISLEPALVDFPVDGAVAPSPVVVGPTAPGTPAPLVQIILNINQAAAPVETAPVVIEHPPVVADAPEVSPVQVVDVAPIAPIAVNPVGVVEAPTPVQVVETAPVAVEPVVVGTPVIPSPAIVLPEDLN